MDYDGGASVNMNLYLQGSVDGVTFADISAPQSIVTDDGTHIWDVSGTGMSFLRVRIEVLGGSMNIQKIIYSAKRRH